MKQHRNRIGHLFKIFVALIILFAILYGCGGNMNRLTVSKQAQKYLINQYGVDFSIIDTERVPDSTGPIPVLFSSYHWELTAESSQFPNSTFKVYYRQDDQENWCWSDNYYSILFQNEVITKTIDRSKQFFAVDCAVQVIWGISPWPEGIDKNCSLAEWFQAGGKIKRIYICLQNYKPSDREYSDFSAKFIAEMPNINVVSFIVLNDEGFQIFSKRETDIVDFWNQHPEFRIDQKHYSDGKLYK